MVSSQANDRPPKPPQNGVPPAPIRLLGHSCPTTDPLTFPDDIDVGPQRYDIDETAQVGEQRRRGGPKSAQGRATVGANALRHGITSSRPVVPGEDEDARLRFSVGIRDSFQPDGEFEEECVRTIASCMWRCRRVVRFEIASITVGLGDIDADVAAYQRGRGTDMALDDLAAIVDALADRLARKGALDRLTDDDAVIDRTDALDVLRAFAPPDLDIEAFPCPGAEGSAADDAWTRRRIDGAIEHLAARADQDRVVFEAERMLTLHMEHLALEFHLERGRTYAAHLHAERALPAEQHLNAIIRYEAHLRRQIQFSLRELLTTQAGRLGYDVFIDRHRPLNWR
jgi:hypothetical protein